MRHSNVESYRSLCHYGYVSKQNVNPQMSSWVHPTFGPFEMGSRNFKTHFCVGNTIYQYLVCINMLSSWKQTICSAKTWSSDVLLPFMLSISELPSINIAPREFPAPSARSLPVVYTPPPPAAKHASSGGYLVGIIWVVILATWMTWQAIYVLIYKIHV